jgi:hypothetical protein
VQVRKVVFLLLRKPPVPLLGVLIIRHQHGKDGGGQFGRPSRRPKKRKRNFFLSRFPPGPIEH